MSLNFINVLRAGLALGSSALSADVRVDFDAAGDFTVGFAGYTDFGDSGAVMLSANSQIAAQQAAMELSAGGVHRLYAHFRYNGASSMGRGLIVGFTDDAGDTYQSSATTIGVDLCVVLAVAGTDGLFGLQILNNGVSVDASLLNATLVDGDWYYLELKVGAVSDGELKGVAAYLYEADADGFVGNALKSLNNSGTGGYNVTSSLAGATAYPFFGVQNSNDIIASVADNFGHSLEPEPVLFPETTVNYGRPEALDGMIEDAWADHPMNILAVDIDGTTPEASDLSGYWQAMWDEDYLYFLLVTEDDMLVTWPGAQFWNWDMTELFLDADYSRNGEEERYDANDSQTVFPRDGQEPFGNGDTPFTFPLANFAQVTDGSATVVEVAFSWEELLVSPFIGMPLGVDLYMKDTDAGAGRENQLSWSPSRDQAWRHPALFGTARLTGEVNSPTGYAAVGAPLQIDGITDAGWDAAVSYHLTVDIDGSAPAPENLSGSWRAMWDEDYLYFLLVTEDDTLVTWPGAQFWNWDMTELFLDADYSRNGQEERYDANDSQTVFPRDGQEPFGNGDTPFAFPLANFAQVTDGAITTTEFSLSWSELGVIPYGGRPLGLDVYMKDSDLGEGRENQLSWSPSRDQAWRYPALFGTLILGDGFSERLALLLQAAPQAGATYRSTWFGEFFQAGEWINHHQLGWLYTGYVTSEDDLQMWSYSMSAYLWTARDFFPICYDYTREAWIYYLILEDGSAAVFDFSLGVWIEGVE